MPPLAPSLLIRAAPYLPAAAWGARPDDNAALWLTPAGPVLRCAVTGPDTGWAADWGEGDDTPQPAAGA